MSPAAVSGVIVMVKVRPSGFESWVVQSWTSIVTGAQGFGGCWLGAVSVELSPGS